ncbi:MAG: SHOCT domain-containing protein [Taibaiella sp.]|nr:SHOCT domain-containing protein [Taibaiella sp.]
MDSQLFKTKYYLRVLGKDYNPFTPDILSIDDHMIVHKRRNWHLISVDTQSYHFQNVIGIEVNKGLIGASLAIETSGSGKIVVKGFSKRTANAIRELCSAYISKNSHRSGTENLANAVVGAINRNASNSAPSVADELRKLKQLLDDGIVTQDEFDTQKSRLLNRNNS